MHSEMDDEETTTTDTCEELMYSFSDPHLAQATRSFESHATEPIDRPVAVVETPPDTQSTAPRTATKYMYFVARADASSTRDVEDVDLIKIPEPLLAAPSELSALLEMLFATEKVVEGVSTFLLSSDAARPTSTSTSAATATREEEEPKATAKPPRKQKLERLPQTSPRKRVRHVSSQRLEKRYFLPLNFSSDGDVSEREESLVLNWDRIIYRFEELFDETFSSNKKAHFDSLPDDWPADAKVVDGARVKWRRLLVLDAIVYLLQHNDFDLGVRRSFNQQRELVFCVFLELRESFPLLFMSLVQARNAEQEAHDVIPTVEADETLLSTRSVDATSPFPLLPRERDDATPIPLAVVPRSDFSRSLQKRLQVTQDRSSSWTTLGEIRSQLATDVPSKARRKFENCVDALCGHALLQDYESDLSPLLQTVVEKALFLFPILSSVDELATQTDKALRSAAQSPENTLSSCQSLSYDEAPCVSPDNAMCFADSDSEDDDAQDALPPAPASTTTKSRACLGDLISHNTHSLSDKVRPARRRADTLADLATLSEQIDKQSLEDNAQKEQKQPAFVFLPPRNAYGSYWKTA